jgi:hypothetical protein
MERREFIKLCSVAGLGVASTGVPLAQMATAGEKNLFWVFVSAGGGWDHTMLCDPKGDKLNSEAYAVNEGFAEGDIGTSGNIEYAPIGYNKTFFDKYSSMTTVIRGIDCETNGHDTGQRNTFSGRLTENTPCFAALYAGAVAGKLPLTFITNGGYSYTAGVVAPTRLGNTNALQALIYPNRLNPQNDASEKYLSDKTMERIRQRLTDRTEVMRDAQMLPRINNSMDLLYTSRLGMGDIAKIDEFLPEDLGNGMARQANIIMAAFKAGLGITATMARGGFDTHGNTDQNTTNALDSLLRGVDALWQRAQDPEIDLADRMVVVIGSDFGRTPSYNMNMGKDHWSVGQMIIQTDPSNGIKGDRIIGGTTDVLKYRKIDPKTLKLSDSGEPLRNSMIHKWFRKFAGIEGDKNVKLFPIAEEIDIDLS